MLRSWDSRIATIEERRDVVCGGKKAVCGFLVGNERMCNEIYSVASGPVSGTMY
jgi:hypothetical protein